MTTRESGVAPPIAWVDRAGFQGTRLAMGNAPPAQSTRAGAKGLCLCMRRKWTKSREGGALVLSANLTLGSRPACPSLKHDPGRLHRSSDQRRGSRQTQGRRTRLRLSQAIPCQPGLCTQPTERLIRNILQAGVEEGILLPGFLTTGLQIGNDSPEDRGQIHAMSAVAQSIEDVLMFSCASHGRGFIDGPVNHSIPA